MKNFLIFSKCSRNVPTFSSKFFSKISQNRFKIQIDKMKNFLNFSQNILIFCAKFSRKFVNDLKSFPNFSQYFFLTFLQDLPENLVKIFSEPCLFSQIFFEIRQNFFKIFLIICQNVLKISKMKNFSIFLKIFSFIANFFDTIITLCQNFSSFFSMFT